MIGKRLSALGATLIVLTAAPGDQSAFPRPDPLSYVVKLKGIAPACDNTRPEATGFAYGPERVMTTAHFVAGTTGSIAVSAPGRKPYEGRVVLFDPGRDVAVLRVPGLRARELVFGPIEPGESATFAGYPRGGDLAKTSGSVGRGFTAHGPDIYHERQIRREVLIVQAPVKPGGTGSPLLRSDGTLSGMVFASDLREPRGYVLTAKEITRPAMDGKTATAAASTQKCL
ncbi:trypsin-like peptidase domain-containing protein [Nonomuraea sp. NPDC059007]|uniref:trypsin-like peptidase domain-containing protein n=1 Tax=Nonomuraea sp. NPDC059007 TaxID=3346692 RepID=UPI0036866709